MISEWTSCLSDSSCPYMMKCMGLGVANLFECSKAKEITYCNSGWHVHPSSSPDGWTNSVMWHFFWRERHFSSQTVSK